MAPGGEVTCNGLDNPWSHASHASEWDSRAVYSSRVLCHLHHRDYLFARPHNYNRRRSTLPRHCSHFFSCPGQTLCGSLACRHLCPGSVGHLSAAVGGDGGAEGSIGNSKIQAEKEFQGLCSLLAAAAAGGSTTDSYGRQAELLGISVTH